MNFFEISPDPKNSRATVKIFRTWNFRTPKRVLTDFAEAVAGFHTLAFDFSHTEKIDFSALCFLLLMKNYEILHADPEISAQITAFEKFHKKIPEPAPKPREKILKILAKKFQNSSAEILNFTNFLGMVLHHVFLAILRPSRLRLKSLIFHMHEQGFCALPVAILTTFIVSFAIALQSSATLDRLGAGLLAIDTTAKLSLREMGPFVLALVIAGRSSSSFTAQLGSMGITDEISAMRAMDFSIMDFLVLPRFLALVIIMPFLIFLGDMTSIFAGMLALKLDLNISFAQYLERFYQTIGWHNFMIGIIKAPFFGAAIALVGTYRGLEFIRDTQSLGRAVIKSVINALFWIILIDALASILFTRIWPA